MRTTIKLFVAICATCCLTGCIKNDIPYPRIIQEILALEAEGEISPAVIDSDNLSATITLGEDVDIRKVRFTEFKYTEGAECNENLLEGTYDLSRPITVTLSKYQSYQWVIEARQTIERYFTIEGQIGESVIDVPGKRIIVTVPDNLNIRQLKVTSIKLGPQGHTTVVPEVKAGDIVDFTKPLHLDVTSFGRTEKWTVYIQITETLVSTTAVDAWSQVIWAYGAGPEDALNGFEYRKKGETDWIAVPENSVTHNGGAFSCCIPHLTPLTSYEVRAFTQKDADRQDGNIITVTTQATRVLIDGSFDQWWLKDNKIWCPWNQDGERFWDTGNTGAATLGNSNVVPSDFTPGGSGKSAKLETKFVGIGTLGKLAAGSIYTGEFVKVDGTNGILDFGRKWNVRPTKLKGYLHYTTGPINYPKNGGEFPQLIGRPDSCHIYVAMADWTAPYVIRTNPKNRQLFDKNSPSIIAYGELVIGHNTNGWQEFEIVLTYRSTSRIPTYLQITAAASKYGDYFTGSTEACLYVDQFSLSYDY